MSDVKYTISQQEAINWNEGALLVLAGPGSGKTAVLTARIAKIISESTEENFKILALTFTNKAAKEMNERVLKLVPGAKGRLFIGTFHGFCAEILRNHGSTVGVKPDFDIFSEENDLKSIVEELQVKYANEFGEDNVVNLNFLSAIKFFQERLCYSEDDIDKIMPKTQYADAIKWMYLNYQSKLNELNVLDYNSLVMKTYQLLSTNKMIAKLYKIAYKYICIDEFQDTNIAQYSLIKSFANIENANIFIVADDDQVIYGWNGASNKRVIEFKNEYKAELIQLSENFRCPEQVVDLANKLIANNAGRVGEKRPLIAKKESSYGDEVVCLKSFNNESEEVDFVLSEIREIKKIFSDATIGVIARNNRLLEKFYEKLKTNGIPVVKSKRKDEFENIYVRWLHYSLKLANRGNDKNLLSEVVNGLVQISDIDINVEEIVTISETNKYDYLNGLCEVLESYKETFDLYETICYKLCNKLDLDGYIDDAFDYFDKIVSEKSDDLIDDNAETYSREYQNEKMVWRQISNQLKNKYGDSIGLNILLQEFAMFSKEDEPKSDDVQCLTIHASKGKEFDYVFVVGLVEDELPSFQSIKKGDKSNELEEERRNCFVAITRTKKKLYLSYSNIYNNWSKKPSRFLKEIGFQI